MSIHDNIVCLRKQKLLTQEQLGAMLGVSGQAVSKWEKGESMPDIMLLPDLSIALDTSIEYLLGVSKTSDCTCKLPPFGDCLKLDDEAIAYPLRILTNGACLAVLRCMKTEAAVTRDEIMELTQMDFDSVTRILHGFLKRRFIRCTYDDAGKHGYLFGDGLAGVRLILAGCRYLRDNY